MEPRKVRTAADARAIVAERGLTHVKCGVFDIDGIMRGKYMSRAKFESALESGFGFCDVVLGWDSKDQLYDNALAAADKAALFKTFAKVHAQRQGLMATFMAKWSKDWPGQSGHIHLSLRDSAGKPVFHDPAKPFTMSDTMRWFVGGQQKLMPELLAMVSPTVNSYTRLIPGFWAPTDSAWSVDNRTCALRVIQGGAKSQRVEYRVAAADANPYIILSAALASGLWGIENKVEPEPVVEGNAYDMTFPDSLALPRTLWEAAQRLKASAMAREWFGEEFVHHFAASREWEEREFRRHITDWELARYFEII